VDGNGEIGWHVPERSEGRGEVRRGRSAGKLRGTPRRETVLRQNHSRRQSMKLKRTRVPNAGVTRRGRRQQVAITSFDVILSTTEIRDLIHQLELLKREGRTKTGYHIHLSDTDANGRERIEVGLFHEKTYSPHRVSETIILNDPKR
jgi:hypothetical protein